MADAHSGGYYVPHGTKWPIMGSIGLTALVGGFASMLNGSESGTTFMVIGVLVVRDEGSLMVSRPNQSQSRARPRQMSLVDPNR